VPVQDVSSVRAFRQPTSTSPEREGAGGAQVQDNSFDMSPSSGQAHLRRATRISVIGLTLVTVVSLTACSDQVEPIVDDASVSGWAQGVHGRWAGQPGELGSGIGVNNGSSRLSVGTTANGERKRIRVSVACQGHGTTPMAVWSGRIAADGGVTGRQLATRSIQCGHDEDLYVATSSSWITIGPTAGDSSVGWYAAAYTELAAKGR
jgi:hypothetical protein